MTGVLVVSPHLDDAVLACGRWLAAHPQGTALTVLAGEPRDGGRLTDWDARCGFASAAQAIETRRAEDHAALATLRATPVWLDFCDAQYEQPADAEAIAEAIGRALTDSRPDTVLFPLGLFHSDHLRVHDASRLALRALPGVRALAYEDVPYRGLPGVLQRRLAELAARGVRATPARATAGDAYATAKRAALRAYASQWRGFGERGLEDAAQPERFWTLEDDAHG